MGALEGVKRPHAYTGCRHSSPPIWYVGLPVSPPAPAEARDQSVKTATIGVSQVDTSGLQVQKPEAEAQMYTEGDTLWKIAKKFYGNGSKYPEIVKANTPPVKNPDLIQPGWVLRIPPEAGSKTA